MCSHDDPVSFCALVLVSPKVDSAEPSEEVALSMNGFAYQVFLLYFSKPNFLLILILPLETHCPLVI